MSIQNKLFIWLTAILLSLSILSCKNSAQEEYKKGFADGYSKAKSELQQDGNNAGPNNQYNKKDRINKTNNQVVASNGDVPSYALETLKYIEEHNEAPQGYVGGREFKNFEGLLPKKADDGTKLKYQEWDVHPKVNGKNRGAERLVTSSNDHAYFTADHYKSFTKIK
jgi:ribonuclease T1